MDLSKSIDRTQQPGYNFRYSHFDKFQFVGQFAHKKAPSGRGLSAKLTGGEKRLKVLQTCDIRNKLQHFLSLSRLWRQLPPRGSLWALPRHYLINGNLYRVVVGLTTLWYYNYSPGGVPNWKRALPEKWQFVPGCCRVRPMVWCLPHRLSPELGAGPARLPAKWQFDIIFPVFCIFECLCLANNCIL